MYQVNKHLETGVPGVFTNGGAEFTCISLDDFRIVFNYLTGDIAITLKRGAVQLPVPQPPLAQVGLAVKPEQQVDRLLSKEPGAGNIVAMWR